MKNVLLGIFLFCSLGNIHGQEPSFNLIKDAGYPSDDFRDMIVFNDTILGYGVAFEDTINWRQGVFLAMFDSSGALLKSTLILDTLDDALAVGKNWGKVIKTSDGGYAATAATFYRKSALLIKLDSDLEIEFIKEYDDTVNVSNFAYRLIEIHDGFLLYGYVQQPNLFEESFVRRVDGQGSVTWNNYYGMESASDVFLDAVEVSDSLYLFGGVLAGPTFHTGRSVLKWINLYGEVVDSWTSAPNPEMGFFRHLQLAGDGGIYLMGQYVADVVNGNPLLQATFSKLNADKEFEWIHHMGRIKSAAAEVTFRDMELLPGGGLIAAGESGVEINDMVHPTGWLVRVSPEGDSLWSRYDQGPWDQPSLSEHYFGGVGLLSSGNIVAGGSAAGRIWLVKVTPDGCLDTLFCQNITSIFEAQKEAEVKVFPNPASNHFSLQSILPAQQVRLFDGTGRQVWSWQVTGAFAEQHQFDLPQGLPSGIYFVSFQLEDGQMVGEKLLVEGQ